MLDNPFGEGIFPNIQSKSPLVQLEAIASCPIASYLGEDKHQLILFIFKIFIRTDTIAAGVKESAVRTGGRNRKISQRTNCAILGCETA